MMQSLIAAALLLAPAAALTAPAPRARPRRTALKSIKVTYLEPDAAADMGVREWPFSDRKDGAEETVPAGAQRYVLKGTGTVECSDYAGGVGDDEPQSVGPGSLVECEAQTNLKWNGDFTVLTPSFEDWTEYLSTVAILILFFGFLLANAGNFG
mmetsp:Transcript_16450/g.43307  ORF Transcript_16450/g.43307 Transcript_16450/m.43307 type:complete len:154 (+) Transcript_16450:229-690(+)